MLLLLGASGYVGSAFAAELTRRGRPFRAVGRREVDYTRFEPLYALLRETRPEFLVNCAGYTGKPNVDACETHRADTLMGNVLLPETIAHACSAAAVPWGHVSSGCIYSGAWIVQDDGSRRIEKDLTTPALRDLAAKSPGRLEGFRESDTPNFSFREPPCSFYSGTKALAEEAIRGSPQTYLWRLRIPFDEFDGSRNYLSKIQRYSRVYDNFNSVSHRSDFAKACLDCWERRAPFGTYNVTNPGWVSTRMVVDLIQRHLPASRKFEFWQNDEEFYRVAAKTPRSNCILDVSKLLAVGVAIRPVGEALEDALRRWVPE